MIASPCSRPAVSYPHGSISSFSTPGHFFPLVPASTTNPTDLQIFVPFDRLGDLIKALQKQLPEE